MRIVVPKEIKDNEFRVGLTPGSVAELVHHGHQVFVETGAGVGAGAGIGSGGAGGGGAAEGLLGSAACSSARVSVIRMSPTRASATKPPPAARESVRVDLP